ncbi:MAG: hypothetical protein ACE5F4_00105 [Candidatus Paceibacteria bacterium]
MPDRNVFGILLVSGAVAFGAVAVAFMTISDERESAENARSEVVALSSEAAASTSRSAETDSDGDGVPDWKETLLGLDPSSPDTDGDGVPDGEWVAQNAGAAAFTSTSAENAPAYVAPNILAPSDALGREVFAAYLALKEGGSLDETAILESVDDIVARRTEEGGTAKHYGVADLTVTPDDSASAIAAYRAQVDRAIARANAVPEYELKTVYTLLETSDLSYAGILLDNADIYRSIADELLSITVPAARASVHITLVNALVDAAYAVEALGNGYRDPYEMLFAVNLFVASEDRFGDAYADFDALTPQQTP